MKEARPLNAYRKEYLAGQRGERDGKRAALYMEAAKLKNAEMRLFAFVLAVGRMGYDGYILPEDFAADICAEVTGGKMGASTYRRAKNNVLVPLGWITSELIPTGQKVAYRFDETGQPTHWRMRQVCVVRLTPPARLLIAKSSKINDKQPRSKRAVAVTREQLNPPVKQGGLDCDTDKSNLKSTSRVNKEAPIQPKKKDSPTSAAPSAQHVKQQHTNSAADGGGLLSSKAMRFGRKRRNRARKTWVSNRAAFLADLYRVAKCDELHRVAKLQTDLHYPALLPIALDFESFIFRWHEYNWRECTRIMRNEVVPALRAFVAPLSPPNPDDCAPGATDKQRQRYQLQRAAHERLRMAFTGLSQDMLRREPPGIILAEIMENRWTLDNVPWLLNTGKFGLRDLRESELALFRNLADMMADD